MLSISNNCWYEQKAVPWLRLLVAGLLPWRPGFAPRSVHAGFLVDKVALGQGFLLVLGCPLQYHSTVYHITWGMDNRPISGRSSETLSYPIDMNRNRIQE
jgi:hypothetical protein